MTSPTREQTADDLAKLLKLVRRTWEQEGFASGRIRPGSKPLTKRNKRDAEKAQKRAEIDLRKLRRRLARTYPQNVVDAMEEAAREVCSPWQADEALRYRYRWPLLEREKAGEFTAIAAQRAQKAYEEYASLCKYHVPEEETWISFYTMGYLSGRTLDIPAYIGSWGQGYTAGNLDLARELFARLWKRAAPPPQLPLAPAAPSSPALPSEQVTSRSSGHAGRRMASEQLSILFT